jgi:hypothetical protein
VWVIYKYLYKKKDRHTSSLDFSTGLERQWLTFFIYLCAHTDIHIFFFFINPL